MGAYLHGGLAPVEESNLLKSITSLETLQYNSIKIAEPFKSIWRILQVQTKLVNIHLSNQLQEFKGNLYQGRNY